MKTLAQRRQSAPSLVISKALSKSRMISREGCFSPIIPEACPLVQSFIVPNRMLIMDGHVQLKTGLQTQERHLFLFNDILVIAKSKSVSHFKLKNHVQICEMWTASCIDEVCEGSINSDRSFVVGWPTTNCVATFSTAELKEKWLSSLQSQIKEEKEKDHPKSIPVKIFAKDVGNCAYSKTLTVTNTDTTTEVIKMVLQQFGISGSVKEYQLWVSSGKEDAPYPLIGHEYPFSIKMSHIRDIAPQTPGSKDYVYPLDLQGSFLMEQLPQDLQCQFILRPSHVATCQQLNEPSQKPFKRKRSIINWAFWRGSGTQLDSVPLSPTSPTPGRLFGLSLPAICEDNNLPKPIMDMLSLLFQEGPFTRGIFRRSANAKACRELKEKLNTGAEVHLACESVFVTAAVFKDFLRHIPGSIFSSELYDKWITVMDKPSHEERIQIIQSLMMQLPKANFVLLHHLFGVLHSIEKQSEDNQMNAFNLAVCIAPSMLWPPTPSSPEVESESTKKVSIFVQFLIENCSKVFGDDITALFGDLPRRPDTREDSSDVSSFQLNDSSYDSLENELNDDVDSLFTDLMQKRSQDNRSRDSVLTLSDCDLDQPEVEGIQIELPPKSKPMQISVGMYHKPTSREHSENESLCSSTSGYSSTTISDALRNSRRYRRCSEPVIGLLASHFGQLNQQHETVARKASCDAVITHVDEDYLKQLRTLQIEGQKLINQTLNMGIDMRKTNNSKRKSGMKDSVSSSRLQPPPPLKLNICSTTSCSSLSSPGTSPSGSSMSSLDSAFSQFSDYSVFTPNETCSPLDCNLQPHRKEEYFSSVPSPFTQFSGQVSQGHCSSTIDCSSPKQEKSRAVSARKENTDWPLPKSPVTLHPNTWLKNGASTVKNWTLQKKDKGSNQDDKRKRSSRVSVSGSQAELSNGLVCKLPSEGQRVLPQSLPLTTEHKLSAVQRRQPNNLPSYEEALQQSHTAAKGLTVKDVRLLAQQDDGNTKGDQREKYGFVSCKVSTPKLDKHSPVGEQGRIPQTVFYGQSISFLGKSCPPLPVVRRCSEPAVGFWKAHNISQNSFLKSVSSSEMGDQNDKGTERDFCLSPKTTEVVKDYFLQTDAENCFQKTQEITNAMIQSRREWQKKRCSDPKLEDFDQMFFAEESYV
nr:PREDICTED: rho GTPase-activating protein 20-like isoform X2 [Latimeria chalumnae]XP_014352129.1 PREDICTED: rho GTPase-activating protein 20-like isoform X2 [Latimeria chalumnae]|eukprot:XP_014352128.1 PREDICTED: rho GTPase-activating protein 20-like isoform X2 [Latimeria chalumnae]